MQDEHSHKENDELVNMQGEHSHKEREQELVTMQGGHSNKEGGARHNARQAQPKGEGGGR